MSICLAPFPRYSLRSVQNRYIWLPILRLSPTTEGFPCRDDLRKILPGCQRMAKVPNGVEILPKILIAWVGCTDITDERQATEWTDRWRTECDGRMSYFQIQHLFVCTCYIFIASPYWIVYSLLVSGVALVGVRWGYAATLFISVTMPDPQDILNGFKLYPAVCIFMNVYVPEVSYTRIHCLEFSTAGFTLRCCSVGVAFDSCCGVCVKCGMRKIGNAYFAEYRCGMIPHFTR